MELIEAVKSRKSIRGFKPTPVSKETLTQLLDAALWAPSGLNVQPWELIVLTGESLQKARRITAELMASGAQVDVDVPGYQLTGRYQERSRALGKGLFHAIGIKREDEQRRREWGLQGIGFYGAPAAILVCLDAEIFNARSQMPLLDAGLLTQTIALLALEYGLGTCIEGAPLIHSSALKKALDMPASKCLVVALAIGYPDWDFPANQFRAEREPLDSMVTWKS